MQWNQLVESISLDFCHYNFVRKPANWYHNRTIAGHKLITFTMSYIVRRRRPTTDHIRFSFTFINCIAKANTKKKKEKNEYRNIVLYWCLNKQLNRQPTNTCNKVIRDTKVDDVWIVEHLFSKHEYHWCDAGCSICVLSCENNHSSDCLQIRSFHLYKNVQSGFSWSFSHKKKTGDRKGTKDYIIVRCDSTLSGISVSMLYAPCSMLYSLHPFQCTMCEWKYKIISIGNTNSWIVGNVTLAHCS